MKGFGVERRRGGGWGGGFVPDPDLWIYIYQAGIPLQKVRLETKAENVNK